jgi:ATP-dependent helicase HrpA
VILGGIPSHLANLDQEGRYQSTRGRQVTIFPASVLAKKTPKWIMAFSLIETGRLYAHTVATINPQWAISDLTHLHQYDYYEPHWQQKQARVGAFRNTRIYGLLVEGGRRVNYASVNPTESREIFIREALVEGHYATKVEFIRANRKLIDYYREQEERERRRDLLIGEQQVFEFYAQRLPDSVVDGVSFEAWAKKLSADEIRALTLFDQDVLATDHKRDLGGYPEFLELKNQRLKLSYVFDPADEADGVSVMLPLALLNQFDDADFDFLVPGLLLEKIEALIRGLPKALRKNFIPAPDFARACLDGLKPEGDLYRQLSTLLLRMTGVEVTAEQWQPESLDAHFRMRYCLVDDRAIVASSRSLAELKQDYAERANVRFEQQVQHDESISREGLSAWDFDKLPASTVVSKGGTSVTAFPALVDYHESVAIELFETAVDASFYHASGVARLFLFALADKVKYCRKNMPQIEQSALLYLGHGTREELVDDILMASVFACFLGDGLPADRTEFEQALKQQEGRFIAAVNEISKLVYRILQLSREQGNRMETLNLPVAHKEDIEEQCAYLVYPGFVRDIDPEHLQRVPVYLQALGKRLDKMEQDTGQADRALPVVRGLWQEYLQHVERDDVEQDSLNEIRWLIEEYRINSFAQPMRTRVPVSESRIRKKLQQLD